MSEPFVSSTKAPESRNERANLDRAIAVQNRAAFSQFHGLIEVLGFEEQVALNGVLGFDVGTIGVRFGLAANDLARCIAPLPKLLDVPIFFERIFPVHPIS